MKIQDILEASDLSRNTQSTSLNRALKQAYAQFPTAKNDTEAFASWAMAKQDNAENLIGKQAELTRRQDAVIKNIDKDNIDQEKKLQALDQENDQMADELDQVEKRLSMTPRRDTSAPQATAEPAPVAPKDKSPATVTPGSYAPPATPAKPTGAKQSNLPAVSAAAPAVGSRAFNTMLPHLGSQQKELPFEPADNVYMPTKQRQLDPRFAAARADATDIDPERVRSIAKDVIKDPVKFRAMKNSPSPEEVEKMLATNESNKEQKPERPEADYGDDYQRMVQRVKKLAGLGPLKTVYDPQKRVYRNVPTAVQPPKK
jgi:hypothetical protein